MILYEYEGKQLLQQHGINVPDSELTDTPDYNTKLPFPVILKAQVLSGKRAEAGGIIKVEVPNQISNRLKALFESTINNEQVSNVLIEEQIEFDQEFYLSVSYDTDTRGPIITISHSGGTGVEDRRVTSFPVDPLHPNDLPEEFNGLLPKLVKLFFDQDLILLEINPLVRTHQGWMALDAKIKLDDSAAARHPEWQKYPPRSAPGHAPTSRETAAKKIDEGDYRGVAGSAFFDLPGDIAVMASGGGASLVALDALITAGGHPANYTEYGGNPPKEKVAKLTQIVLDKPGLHGLWVVGALANFTNIYQTLQGFVEGLRQAQTELGIKFDFPIVIRRAGPNDTEARQMLSEVKDFDLHVYGEEISITRSAEIITELAAEYAKSPK